MDRSKQPIIVATDFSEAARNALVRAIILARATGAGLRVVHVVATEVLVRRRVEALRHVTGGGANDLEELRDMLRDEVDRALGLVGGARPSISTDLRSGDPLLVLAGEANSADAGLILVGTHDHDFLADALIGTTAEKIIAQAHVPVLVVKRRPGRPYQRVLVAVDFSEDAEKALDASVRYAGQAEFHLLHALSSSQRRAVDDGATATGVADTWSTPEARLEGLARRAHLPASHSTCQVIEGEAREVIAAEAHRLEADLLVVGSRGLNPLMGVLLGSVSRHVLRVSDCDVMVVRSVEIEH